MPSSIILGAVFGDALMAAAALGSVGYAVASFAINMVVSSIITKALGPSNPNTADSQNNPNPGNRQQLPPATDNKLPVVYGSAFVGGTVTDLSISSDNQTMFYCLALSEVTNTENGGSGDVFTFGNIYWGGKRCVFDGTEQARVVSLLDESTGESQTNVDGKLYIYTFRNGSYTPTNGSQNAIQLMSSDGLVYKWNSSKLMSNCAFAIIKVIYNQDAGLTGLQQTKFQVTNPRSAPGDCFYDYLTSSRYGAAIPVAQIDSASLTALNTYCAGSFAYTAASGVSATQTRFRFDGTVDTQQTVMNCMQQMAASCDCLLRYNEILATWGVIVQSPSYSVAMAIDDSNMVSAIQINPTDLASTPNIIETKFANGSEKDTFASAVFSLQQLAPSLLYPNEPVNKQSASLPLINNDVRAQYIATRLLKAGREDLIVKVQIDYSGLQLEAGDIVSLTSQNYGWTAKLFRISQVTQNITDDGQVTASLTLIEYNASVYDDAAITQFQPAPNTGIPSPLIFGALTAPVVSASYPNGVVPSITVNVKTASSGVVQYAELWYSAYPSASSGQMIFAGTTAIQSNGQPYLPNTVLPVTLTNIAAGNWYFYSRMVNQLGTSGFSPASSLLQWRPTTFAYPLRYLIVAYADSITGSGMSSSPAGKSYYGLFNSNSSSYSTSASDYTWFEASPAFGSSNKLCFINRTGRLFSFGIAPATYASGTAAYVPSSTFDDTIWSALPDGQNWIDLDLRTGQLTRTGTTSTGGGQLSIVNNPNGTMVGQLQQFLTFPDGSSTYTGNAANLTIDIYGRVVGLVAPDTFYFSSYEAVATAGQTVFTPTARQAGYITGQDLIFHNGILLDTSEYTETNTTVTLNTACAAGDNITVISFRSVNANAIYYEMMGMTYSSGSGTSVCTYSNLPYQTISAGDKLTFSNSGTPTQYTVSSVNYVTKQITFTGNFTATTGAPIYRARAISATYPSFSRWNISMASDSSITPSTFQIVSGAELLFINGTVVNDQDYDITSGSITNFPDIANGNLTVIQFANSNLGVPNGSPAVVSTNTVNGQDTYNFTYNPDAFELYNTGVLQVPGVDYATGPGSFVLSTTPTYNTNVLSQQTFNRNGAA